MSKTLKSKKGGMRSHSNKRKNSDKPNLPKNSGEAKRRMLALAASKVFTKTPANSKANSKAAAVKTPPNSKAAVKTHSNRSASERLFKREQLNIHKETKNMNGTPIIGVFHGNKNIAHINLLSNDERTILTIDGITVDPSYRGKGIGYVLLKYILEDTFSKPTYTQIELDDRTLSNQFNPSQKQNNMYERLGFVYLKPRTVHGGYNGMTLTKERFMSYTRGLKFYQDI